ncbi:hypothetical protein QF049_001082 [Paenibacillus sp. W4I10]|uniref:phage tail protein n=1 Tax=Paenibacillus sp. W4I10 TaxID=3042298 RepID=UPI002786785E|nr:phage tail protein [Paenibacillus sp. W4I10]MDQ0719821.1 hypothetical protein [Paenibacillus sp. W4I10]
MVIKEPRKFVTTDQGHADVLNIPITTLYENDQELAAQVESIKSDPAANGVASKEALDAHAVNTELHVTAAKQAIWDSAQANAELYTRNNAAPKAHTHPASDLPSASTQARGITKLNNSVSSSATDEAATANAVKQAYDEATAAKQLGNERKADVVAALVAIGVAASTSDTWTQLISKMAGVIRATGNATVAQVLAGATFSNATGNGRTGMMPNRSAENHHQPAKQSAVWAGDLTFLMPPDGYYTGDSWVCTPTPDLKPENLLVGKNVMGVAGSYVPNEVLTLSGLTGKDGTTNGANLDTWITNVPSNRLTVISSASGITLNTITSQYTDNYALSTIMLRDAAGRDIWIQSTSSVGSNVNNYLYVVQIIIDPINRRYRSFYYTQIDRTIQSTAWTAFASDFNASSMQLVHRALVRGTDSYKGRATAYYPESTWTFKF